MLFEVEVAFIVQPGLVPKQFLQGNGLSLYFWANFFRGCCHTVATYTLA